MDDALYKIIKSKGFYVKNIIRDNVLIVTKDKKDYVCKTFEKRWETFSSFQGKLFALTGINRYNFRNEIIVHQHLASRSFETLKIPKLYETDGKSYMIMDYIEGTMGRRYTSDMDRVLINSLVDLNLSTINQKKLIKSNVLSFLRRPFWNVMRMVGTIALPKLGFKIAFKCFVLCLRLERKVSSNKAAFLLHKDINNKGNIISDSEGRMYFIDFESCLQESKWILTDIIEIIYSFKDEYMDVALFDEYIKKMRALVFIEDGFDIKSQVRFAMLRNAIKYLGFEELYCAHRKQLLDIIIPDEKFNLWFYEIFEKKNANI